MFHMSKLPYTLLERVNEIGGKHKKILITRILIGKQGVKASL